MTTDFAATRKLFSIPNDIVYLDGNSLGPLPVAAAARVGQMLEAEWGDRLIRGWNDCGWMQMPTRVGDRIAALIGAAASTVVVGDTLSIKVYQAVASALELRPDRLVVLTDSGNFPSDLYMAEGLLRSLDKGHELRVVEPHQVEDAIDESVAVVMLTEVDYRTGRLHDMARLTAAAHATGALTIWDLAHSAGALRIDVSAARADFAVGCTYKYLNGGPGAPAFIYVAPELIDQVRPALAGWLGHDAPFDFERDYRAGAGIERMRVGTPPILQLTALDAALDVWDIVDIDDVRTKAISLCELFISEVEAACPQLTLASPRAASMRGSQVSFHYGQAEQAINLMSERGVIGDFRSPDIMRFGFTPLYIDEVDVKRAVDILVEVVS